MLSRINDNKVMVKTEYGMSTRIPTIKPTIASEISCILTKHITTQQVKKSTTIILNPMMTIVYIMRYLDYKRKGKRDAIQNKTPE